MSSELSDGSSAILPTAPSHLSPGELANQYASRNLFTDHHERLAANTRRRQKNELSTFARYLGLAGLDVEASALYDDPSPWSHITHGLVDGFRRWLLQNGYAIGSINLHLSTVKTFCQLAVRAGTLEVVELAMIQLVKGYSYSEGINVDEGRQVTRIGHKKADVIVISKEQAKSLKDQPDTPQGRRDTLLMCLLLDHGLRCGEVAALELKAVEGGFLSFYRKKVKKVQKHRLSPDTAQALARYLVIAHPEHSLIMGSRKGGQLVGRMSERSITARVEVLCARVGIEGASAHDGRHAWATIAVASGTDIKSLQDAGGWTSPAMPLRYVTSAEIANEGVKLA
jgi:integrase